MLALLKSLPMATYRATQPSSVSPIICRLKVMQTIGDPRDICPEIADWISQYRSAGFQLAVHGNASIDDILDAFEKAQAAFPKRGPRLILIHAQMARQDQLARIEVLGVSPSFFSAHT